MGRKNTNTTTITETAMTESKAETTQLEQENMTMATTNGETTNNQEQVPPTPPSTEENTTTPTPIESDAVRKLREKAQAMAAKAVKTAAKGRPCECGCGGQTKGGHFLPGHDAKLLSRLLAEARAIKPEVTPQAA